MGRLEGRLFSRAMTGKAESIRRDLFVVPIVRQHRRFIAGGKEKKERQNGKGHYNKADVIFHNGNPFLAKSYCKKRITAFAEALELAHS
jgi:hypothetical protein